MSMHLKPLTPIEEAGLRAHGLPVGKPSQLADAFRLGMAWSEKARAEAALADSSVWVLTSSCNDYDQHGEYFEAVFKDKPTRESIMEACGVTEEGADHILLGGGRKGGEYVWFNLRQEALP